MRYERNRAGALGSLFARGMMAAGLAVCCAGQIAHACTAAPSGLFKTSILINGGDTYTNPAGSVLQSTTCQIVLEWADGQFKAGDGFRNDGTIDLNGNQVSGDNRALSLFRSDMDLFTNTGIITSTRRRSDGTTPYLTMTIYASKIRTFTNAGGAQLGNPDGGSAIYMTTSQDSLIQNLINDGLIASGDASTIVINLGHINSIVNTGTISSKSEPVFAFYRTLSTRMTIDNSGTIASGTAPDSNINIFRGLSSSVINKSIDFTNRDGATVRGAINFGSADDLITLYGGSTVTGNISGGSGTDAITLRGLVNGSHARDITDFETLTKIDPVTWTLGGTTTIGAISIQAGTLRTTGSLLADSITIDPGAELEIGDGGTTGSFNASTLNHGGSLTFNHSDDISVSGNIGGPGDLVKKASGRVILSGANTYTGGTNVIAGTLGLGSDTAAGTGTIVMQDLTTLQAAADLTLTNLIDLKGAVTFDTQGYSMTINTGITNAVGGQLIKTGLGTLTLNGVNTYTAGTIVQEGTLALYGSLASSVEVQSGAIFGGTGTVTGDVTNAGTLQPRLNGSRSTLTLIGNYVGQGGTFATTLSGTPDAIEADRLAIQGAGNTASGSTTIVVADPDGLLGKPIEGDGVLLVQFTGATGGPDAFTAPRIAAGAYEYVVERGGSTSSENWYLRSDIDEPQPPVVITPERTQREEVALYPSLPSLARQYLWSINGTLDDRRGAPELLGQWHRQPVAWGRLIAQGNELEPGNLDNGPGLKSNDWGLQLGADLWRRDSDWGQWRAGPVLTMGRSTGQAYNTTGAVQTGSVSLSAYSLGLNATVASQAGAYADLLLMGTRLAGVNANSPLGTSINTTGWALSGSIEGGWQIPMSSRVTITPQAQLYLTSVNLATTEDAYATIQMPTQTTTLGRLGLKLAYDNAEAGQPHTQFWVRASLFSTLSGQDAPTSFLNLAGTNPTTFHSQAPSTWMTIDAALNLKATDSTSVQLGLGYQTSFSSQYRGVYGQVNLRIGF